MSFVSPAGIEKPAVPMISVLTFLPFLGLLLTARVRLPTHVAVPLQLSFTLATPFRTPRLDPSSLTEAVAATGAVGAGGLNGLITRGRGRTSSGGGLAQLGARPVPVAVIFPIRPS